MFALLMLASALFLSDSEHCAAVDSQRGGVRLDPRQIELVIEVYRDWSRRGRIFPTMIFCDDVEQATAEFSRDANTRLRLARAHVPVRTFVADTLAIALAANNHAFPHDRHLAHNRALLQRYRARLRTVDLDIQPDR